MFVLFGLFALLVLPTLPYPPPTLTHSAHVRPRAPTPMPVCLVRAVLALWLCRGDTAPTPTPVRLCPRCGGVACVRVAHAGQPQQQHTSTAGIASSTAQQQAYPPTIAARPGGQH